MSSTRDNRSQSSAGKSATRRTASPDFKVAHYRLVGRVIQPETAPAYASATIDYDQAPGQPVTSIGRAVHGGTRAAGAQDRGDPRRLRRACDRFDIASDPRLGVSSVTVREGTLSLARAHPHRIRRGKTWELSKKQSQRSTARQPIVGSLRRSTQ